jgi:two-component system cell cycle response regulator
MAVSMEKTVKEYQRQFAEQIAAHQREMDDLNRQLQQTARIDDATGLFTARVFHEFLPRELQRARRYQHLLSLVVFDVDDFARLIELSGTLEGERVLREFAQLVPGRMREVDLLCRLDVDEFAVILPETPVQHAGLVAERIRETTEAHRGFVPESHPAAPIRVSAGVAGFPDDASTAEELLERARTACQHAKRLGKNQVTVYSETQG